MQYVTLHVATSLHTFLSPPNSNVSPQVSLSSNSVSKTPMQAPCPSRCKATYPPRTRATSIPLTLVTSFRDKEKENKLALELSTCPTPWERTRAMEDWLLQFRKERRLPRVKRPYYETTEQYRTHREVEKGANTTVKPADNPTIELRSFNYQCRYSVSIQKSYIKKVMKIVGTCALL